MASRRTMILGGLASLALALNIATFVRFSPADRTDVHFKITSIGVIGSRQDRMPLFDPATSGWTLDGQPITDLFPYTEFENYHYGRNFLTFAVPTNTGMRGIRRALVALAAQRICHVSIFDADTLKTQDRPEATAIIITRVRDQAGAMHPCNPRIDKTRTRRAP